MDQNTSIIALTENLLMIVYATDLMEAPISDANDASCVCFSLGLLLKKQ